MSRRRARGATEQELKPARTGFIPTPQLRAATADTLLEHMCRLGIDSPPITARNTGVICTIGPASRSVETLQETMKSGMNVARVHLALRTCGYQAETITALGIFASNPILYLPGVVALNTKGSEGRQHRGGRAEGSHVKITLGRMTAVKLGRSWERAEHQAHQQN